MSPIEGIFLYTYSGEIKVNWIAQGIACNEVAVSRRLASGSQPRFG